MFPNNQFSNIQNMQTMGPNQFQQQMNMNPNMNMNQNMNFMPQGNFQNQMMNPMMMGQMQNNINANNMFYQNNMMGMNNFNIIT